MKLIIYSLILFVSIFIIIYKYFTSKTEHMGIYGDSYRISEIGKNEMRTCGGDKFMCPKPYINKKKGPDGKPFEFIDCSANPSKKCDINTCCERPKNCGGQQFECPVTHKKLSKGPNGEEQSLIDCSLNPAGACNVETCCEEIKGVCNEPRFNNLCPTGFEKDTTKEKCSGYNCKSTECCKESNGKCGDSIFKDLCKLPRIKDTSKNSKECSGPQCSVSECCKTPKGKCNEPRFSNLCSNTCKTPVTLYQHGDFKGWAARFNKGNWPLSTWGARGAKNDDASAIKVPKGCKAELYQHDQFRGWKAHYEPGDHNFAKFLRAGAENDRASSIKIMDQNNFKRNDNECRGYNCSQDECCIPTRRVTPGGCYDCPKGSPNDAPDTYICYGGGGQNNTDRPTGVRYGQLQFNGVANKEECFKKIYDASRDPKYKGRHIFGSYSRASCRWGQGKGFEKDGRKFTALETAQMDCGAIRNDGGGPNIARQFQPNNCKDSPCYSISFKR